MIAELSDAAEQLLGRPVYLATTDESGVRMPGSMAFAGRSLDLRLMDWLQQNGRWDGRRPAVVFDLAIISETAAELGVPAEELARAVLLHELGHVLEHGVDESEPTAQAQEIAAGFHAMSVAAMPIRETPETTAVIASAHNAVWVRYVCHLWTRAMRIGCRCCIDLTYAAELYGIPEPYAAVSALGSEPEGLLYLPLARLSDIKPPRRFTTLFQNNKTEQEQ